MMMTIYYDDQQKIVKLLLMHVQGNTHLNIENQTLSIAK